jgi:protein ImuB
MMRYAALSLPYWPTERLKLSPADSSPNTAERPFVLTQTGAGGERLYALTPAAEAAGLSSGMGVADARALAPALQARGADPDGDQAALKRLARWSGRFSPWTAPDAAAPGLDGVLLDISGCAQIFGGEDQLLTRLVRETRALGLTASAAAAPTLGLAWALARFSAPKTQPGWVAVEDVRATLPGLPVEALRIGATATKLRRFGLTQVRDLQALPRASLAKRFGLDLVRRLDQACGQARESLTPLSPQADLRARVRFPEPLQTLDAITAAAGDAAARLCEALEREGLGLTRLRLTLYRVDGRARDLLVGVAAPSRDAAHLHRLLRERLARAEIDIGFGVDLVEAGAALARRLDAGSGRYGRARGRRG